jgi:tetratricopeptide (TPR) repeat protein
MGKALARMGLAVQALERFREAGTLDPRNAEAFAGQSLVLANLGRIDEAVAAAREAARLAPREPFTVLGLAEILLRAKRLSEADEVLEDLLERHPRFPQGHALRALTLAQSGQAEPALAHYRTAVALAPDLHRARFEMASLLHQMARFGEAAQEYELLLKGDADNPELLLRLGFALRSAGRNDEALERFTRAVQLDPELNRVLEAEGIRLGSTTEE